MKTIIIILTVLLAGCAQTTSITLPSGEVYEVKGPKSLIEVTPAASSNDPKFILDTRDERENFLKSLTNYLILREINKEDSD